MHARLLGTGTPMSPQNLDTRTRIIKVRPPKTKYFTLREFFKPLSLAGALETRFEVSSSQLQLNRVAGMLSQGGSKRLVS